MDAKRAPALNMQPERQDPQPPSPQVWEPAAVALPKEIGGPAGPEPTRFGDWEKAGRCIDF